MDKLLSLAGDGNIIIWDFAAGELLRIIKLENSIQSFCYLDLNSIVVLGMKDKSFQVREIREDKDIQIVQIDKAHEEAILTIC